MPVYEYACETHGKFTVIKPMADREKPQECPKCRKLCERILSTFSFKVK